MSISLHIADTCIYCRKCVKVCPAQIFSPSVEDDSKIKLDHIDSCIACGHCMDVCPTDSIEHSEFPADKVHPIDYTLMPTPQQTMLLCKARRSNRTFSQQPIPTEMLDMVLEAAHLAPTAMNTQQVYFTLVTQPEKLSLITDITLGTFASIIKKLENPLLKPFLKLIMPDVYKYIPHFQRLILERKQGNDPILRKATAVILMHTPKTSRFGCQDSNLAYQNGSLMAESLGVSQFYTGFVCSALQEDKKNLLAKALGINGNIHAGMALGMPVFRYSKYVDREEISLNRL